MYNSWRLEVGKCLNIWHPRRPRSNWLDASNSRKRCTEHSSKFCFGKIGQVLTTTWHLREIKKYFDGPRSTLFIPIFCDFQNFSTVFLITFFFFAWLDVWREAVTKLRNSDEVVILSLLNLDSKQGSYYLISPSHETVRKSFSHTESLSW